MHGVLGWVRDLSPRTVGPRGGWERAGVPFQSASARKWPVCQVRRGCIQGLSPRGEPLTRPASALPEQGDRASGGEQQWPLEGGPCLSTWMSCGKARGVHASPQLPRRLALGACPPTECPSVVCILSRARAVKFGSKCLREQPCPGVGGLNPGRGFSLARVLGPAHRCQASGAPRAGVSWGL